MSITLERIFTLVKKSGKSEYAIKKETGLKNSTFSEWRAGRANPSTEAIITLAKYFNVSTDYLLGLSDDLPQTKNAALAERHSDIATIEYKSNCEDLSQDEHFVNTAQIYRQLELEIRSALYGELVKWLKNHNIDVDMILGL